MCLMGIAWSRQMWHVAIKSGTTMEKMSLDSCYWRMAAMGTPSFREKKWGILSVPYTGHTRVFFSGPLCVDCSTTSCLSHLPHHSFSSSWALILPPGLSWKITSLKKHSGSPVRQSSPFKEIVDPTTTCPSLYMTVIFFNCSFNICLSC